MLVKRETFVTLRPVKAVSLTQLLWRVDYAQRHMVLLQAGAGLTALIHNASKFADLI